MAFEIDVSCDVDPASRVDLTRLKSALQHALQSEQVAGAVLSLTLVDNPTMQALNREHLQHDYPTDVISFALEWVCADATLEERCREPCGRSAGAAIEGEIVVSLDYAQEMAAGYGWSTQDELTLYAIHGMLHICGYDDLTSQEKEIMRSRERAILKGLGLQPHYPDDGRAADDEPPGPASGTHRADQADHSEGTPEGHS